MTGAPALPWAAEAATQEASTRLPMDEGAFRTFYGRTARALRGYLCGATGDPSAADDLLQESYFRFLRSGFSSEDEAHMRHYLFRIATNLVRDRFRRRRPEVSALPEDAAAEAPSAGAELRWDVWRLLGELKARDRQMLWLAYAEGSTHAEIASVLGLQEASVRSMLFRARQRMGELLREAGFRGGAGGPR